VLGLIKGKICERIEMKRDRWIWMPHPAHYILASRCQYVLSTYVGKYIVSTIGELWSDRPARESHAKNFDPKWWEENKCLAGGAFDDAYFERFGFEDIRGGRKYETMVFKAEKMPKNLCPVCPYRIANSQELDFLGYNDPLAAYKGHLKLCNKWSRKK